MRNIRQSAEAPGGVPEILFNIPSSIGYNTQGSRVYQDDIDVAKEVFGFEYHPVSKHEDLHELFICYTKINRLKIPLDAETALDLYIQLLAFLQNDGFVV